ncbi:tRNA-dihydrouridine synthase 2 [Rhodotorula sphaerocarpa]
MAAPAPAVPTRPLSPTAHAEQPAMKRQRLEQNAEHSAETTATKPLKTPRKRAASAATAPIPLPYHVGMHLAPMRVPDHPPTALDYGAELVWGPEIVDKAIIGAERKVNPRTGVVSFCKNGRSIFDCHPLEKPRLIFQLGSASPDLAVQAMKVIENDVAGVGLNCGCPKSFSLQGGMGAALLKEPEKLCSILSALVQATDLPVDAKIRLLPLPSSKAKPAAKASSGAASPGGAAPVEAAQPTPSAVLEPTVPPTVTVPPVNGSVNGASDAEAPAAAADDAGEEATDPEPTHALVARIFATGIANLTVHCRTQEMRSREPALHERMRGISEMGRERGVPVVCNGDAVGGGKEAGWGNFDEVCAKTGVCSVMIARAAEANPSCFAKAGLADPISEVIPRLLRIAMATENHYNNTKYILNALNLFDSPSPPSREVNRDVKQRMNKAKSYEDMGEVFGIGAEEVRRWREEVREEELEELVPRWAERRRAILQGQREGELEAAAPEAAERVELGTAAAESETVSAL